MLSIVLYAVLAVAAAGLILKFALERYERTGQMRITWLEYGIEMTVMAIVVIPLTAVIGNHVARSNLLTFYEYWNGWELRADRENITCRRDGSCKHMYDCDPYTVEVSYSCGKDNNDTCYRDEVRYHSCPYVKTETTYTVVSTIGSFTISANRFPDHPNEHRWRWSTRVPDYVIARAGTGIPEFWNAAKRRIDAGTPGPVTKRMSYANYVLASDQTILKQHSSDIQYYLAEKLLPPVAHDVYDYYRADKVHFVGYVPEDLQVWQGSLSYLAAALGSELQGDLQLVIVQADQVTGNPDAYAIALKAYWQDTTVFGEDAFSKNGIGVVVGTTDGTTVAWARAFTGMPLGNEPLAVAVRNGLKGKPLTPESLFGAISGQYQNGTPNVLSVRTGGALTPLLWGQENPATRFARVSMTANDPTDNGSGFLYLSSEIQPTAGQRLVIIFCAFLLGLIAWGVCAFGDGDALFTKLMKRSNRS